jgi:single-stranded-DNA-specific exonuclease
MPVIVRREYPDCDTLPASLHPVMRRILAARQVLSEAELDYRLNRLQPFQDLSGISQAVTLLSEALTQNWHILVVADFDADGATACAVAVRALRLLGAAEVGYVVPDRAKQGYGLSPEIVDIAAARQPDLLITVDSGIACLAGVAHAKAHGLRILVTDHHLPAEVLPEADAIVNPNLVGDVFPSKNLAGVGVIFYVMLALRAHLREQGWFATRAEPNLAALLDLVALGTVADVVPLDYNNRILVEQGLRRIRQGACCAGINALIQVSQRNQDNLSASDLAFYLGPRLNAAGRLENMGYGIECLLNDDSHSAMNQAQELDMLNQERRGLEADMHSDALAILLKLEQQAVDLPIGLCLFDEHWHQGVIGILASRIKDRLHRPVIVFTVDNRDENIIKGSARSIRGVHVRDVLNAVKTRHPHMISKFGGHAMAAGLSMPRAEFNNFCQEFDQEVRRHISADALQEVIYSDGELSPSELNLEFAESLRYLSPWGQNFPEPLFDGCFNLLSRQLLKGRHLKMRVQHPQGGPVLDAIAFGTVDNGWPHELAQVQLAYTLDINVYRGRKNLQMMVRHVFFRVCDASLGGCQKIVHT